MADHYEAGLQRLEGAAVLLGFAGGEAVGAHLVADGLERRGLWRPALGNEQEVPSVA